MSSALLLSQSSPLFGVFSAVTGVLAVIAAIWAALYASQPRRGLAYSVKWRPPTGTELVAWVNRVVPYEEQQLPVIVTFVLRGSGRLDVSTSSFDNATPITLSVTGARIHWAGTPNSRRAGGLWPPAQIRDDKLEIRPGLIGRKRVLTYTLIAATENQLARSGPAPVTLTYALIDTKLRTDKRDTLIRLGAIGLVTVVFFWLWYLWLRHLPSSQIIGLMGLVVSLVGIPLTFLISMHANRPPENLPPPDNLPTSD